MVLASLTYLDSFNRYIVLSYYKSFDAIEKVWFLQSPTASILSIIVSHHHIINHVLNTVLSMEAQFTSYLLIIYCNRFIFFILWS